MELTLEKELKARIWTHKVAVLGGVSLRNYLAKQAQEGIKIPAFQLSDIAENYSNEVINKAIEDGTFEEQYEQAWNSIKNTIPEEFKITL